MYLLRHLYSVLVYSNKIWEDVLASYAKQVSGGVRAVVGKNLRKRNIWVNIQLSRLHNNPKVTKIIIIDPKTLEEKVIFRR